MEVKKVLYVEDEVDIQTIAQIALKDIGGFDVLVCSLGKEALEKAPNFNPDLILLDVMMPEMDGPKTFEELKKIDSLKDTPVIFMTAKVQPQEIKEYKNLGAIDVISKPFDPITLAETIKEIVKPL